MERALVLPAALLSTTPCNGARAQLTGDDA
jgi:hypothetical protein